MSQSNVQQTEELVEDICESSQVDDDVDYGTTSRSAANNQQYVWEAGFESTWLKSAQEASMGEGERGRYKIAEFVSPFEKPLETEQNLEGDVSVKKKISSKLQVDDDGRVNRPYLTASFVNDPDNIILCSKGRIKKHCIRHVVLMVDFSNAMTETDIKPNRIKCAIATLEEFFVKFFRCNPVAQICILGLVDKDAVRICPFTSSATQCRDALRSTAAEVVDGGQASLQNAFERAEKILSGSPPFVSKEIILIFGSTASVDGGVIESSLTLLVSKQISVHVVSLTPELFILRRICNETRGSYSVPLDRVQFRSMLNGLIRPPPNWDYANLARRVCIGFPRIQTKTTPTICVCHSHLCYTGFLCPQCASLNCGLGKCAACEIILVSSLDIMHVQGLQTSPPPFSPLPRGDGTCALCFRVFRSGGGQCVLCAAFFCFDCDIFCHEVLDHCPHCARLSVLRQSGVNLPPVSVVELPSSHPASGWFKKLALQAGR